MSVRNFWAEVDVDGYSTLLKGGPRTKEGGMDITLYQRNHGGIETAVRIFCREQNEELTTEVKINGETVGVYATRR